MQLTTTGKVAKSLTGGEFADKMVKYMLPWIQGVVAAHPTKFSDGMRSVIVAMDNATWHKRAVSTGLMGKMHMLNSQLLPHAPNSPDLQGPIENAHAALKRAVQQALAHCDDDLSSDALCTLMEETWSGNNARSLERRKAPVLTPQQVKASFAKLGKVYETIVEAQGQWGKKKY